MTIRIGITGASGTIGRELLNKYPNSVPLVGDITKPQEIEMAVKSEKPDVIVHLAFLSDVDYCEQKRNFSQVSNVNVRGTYNVAEIADKYNCGMMFMSSDHVFDGLWGNYKEKSKPSPKNMYGFTKMTSERFMDIFPNMKVVRTSYLLTPKRVNKFIEDISTSEMEYPTFMYRSFMTLSSFTSALSEYLTDFYHMPDILHISGSQIMSWYEFMTKFANMFDVKNKVYPRTWEMAGVAPRPNRAGLNVTLSRKLGITQYDYYEGLK